MSKTYSLTLTINNESDENLEAEEDELELIPADEDI